MANNTLQHLKAQAGKVKWNELYTLALISLGIPALVYLWSSWEVALTIFVVIQIAIGILREILRERK